MHWLDYLIPLGYVQYVDIFNCFSSFNDMYIIFSWDTLIAIQNSGQSFHTDVWLCQAHRVMLIHTLISWNFIPFYLDWISHFILVLAHALSLSLYLPQSVGICVFMVSDSLLHVRQSLITFIHHRWVSNMYHTKIYVIRSFEWHFVANGRFSCCTKQTETKYWLKSKRWIICKLHTATHHNQFVLKYTASERVSYGIHKHSHIYTCIQHPFWR